MEGLAAQLSQLNEIATVLGVVLVLGLESLWPKRASSSRTLWRWVNNLALMALTYGVISGTMSSLQAWPTPWWPTSPRLLTLVSLPPWGQFLATLVTLELLNYWVHRSFHSVPWLWRLHVVHHSDTELDATTAHRHHPLEGVLTATLTLSVIWLMAPSAGTLLVYVLVRALSDALTHGNLSWGVRANRVLKWVIVTPDFHQVHHCADLPYTDRNFAGLLPIFDHVFGTASAPLDANQMTLPLGLRYFRDNANVRLDQLIAQPFRNEFSTNG
jgi:sterol desaturase/sphingolipid hydroxylase (fatty acid hydroxylase superfamily)